MDSNGKGKAHRRKPKEEKLYDRPPSTMFRRITDSFKSILNPLTRGWLMGTGNEYESHSQTTGSSTQKSDEKASTSNQITLKKAESQNGIDDDIQSKQEVNNQKVERSSLNEDQSKRFKLWTDKVTSSKLQNPAVKNSQFTPTSFGVLQEKRLLNRSTSSYKSLQSPFYPGRTEFGGNNSVQTPNSSFSMPRAKRVEIAQNKRRRIADTSIERISSFDTLNKSTNTPISSTAKKIMRTLETFSSPLSDAKKIPLSQREPTFYSAIRKRRRPERKFEAKKKPPVSSLNTSTKAQTVSSTKTSLNSSLLSYSNQTVKKTVSTGDTSKPPVTSQASVAYNPTNQAGGKMKNKRRAHASSAGVTDEEQPLEQIELPNAVLSIDVKSLPSFFLEKPASTSTPSAKSTNKSATTSKPTFSKPLDIKKKDCKPVDDDESTSEMSFSFSSPKPIQTTSKVKKLFTEEPQFNFSTAVTGNTGDIKSKSNESTTKLFSFDKNKKPSSSVEVDKELVKKPKEFGVDKPSTVAVVSNKRWECQTCMVRNEESKQVCVACTVPREGKIQPKPVSKQTSLSFTTSSDTTSKIPQTNPIKFGLSKENEEVASPLATTVSQTPKPIIKKPAAPADIWMCSVCLIKNQKSSTKCIACETPNPEAGKQVTSGDKSFEYSSSSILKVDAKNQDTKEVESSEKVAESSKSSLGFTFSSTTSNSNTSKTPATSKSSAFTGSFGIPSKPVESEKQTTATPLSAIQFGAKSNSDDSKQKSTGFSFGIASSNKPVEFGIKPTEKPSTTTSAGFNFGVKSTVNTEASKPTLSQQSVLSVLSKTSTATSEPIAAAPATTTTPQTTDVSQPTTQKPSEFSSSLPKSTEKGFMFTSKPAEPASNQPATTPSFNFTSSSSASKPVGFNFGQKPSTSSATTSAFSQKSSFNFQPTTTAAGGFLNKPSQPETTSSGGFFSKPSQPATTSSGGFFSKPSQPETTSAGGFFSKPSQPAASNSMFSATSATNKFQSNSEAKPFSITNSSKQPETDSSKLFAAAPSTSLFGNSNPPSMFSNQSSGIFGSSNNSTTNNEQTA